MTLGAKPQPYSGSNFCFFHNPGSSSGSFRKRAGSRSGSVKFEVKSKVKDEVKLEVKRQTPAETKAKGPLLGRSARFLGGNVSETWFLRGYRQEGFLSCVEKAASFGENLQYLFNSCEEMFVS